MSSCCPNPICTQSTGSFFSKRSRRYARSFKNGKLESIQKFLVEELKKEPLQGKRLLDIGCGVGKLHLTLLKDGAQSATAIDMSEEMLRHARDFARKFGVEQKVTYLQGDFMTVAAALQTAEITLLDKVICCYEDLEGLIAASVAATSQRYALIFPADNFLTRAIFETEIFIAKIFRFGFRPYWHDWRRVEHLLSNEGFILENSRSQLLWQAAVYRKK